MTQKIVLIVGKSASGKTAALRTIKNHKGVLYLNCEANKPISFANQFRTLTVTDPYQVYQAFEEAEKLSDSHTIVIDSLSFLMDMYESLYILPANDWRKAWGEYAQFFKNLMQQYVPIATKNIIIIAHTNDVYNEQELVRETLVKVKGSLMNQGIESYFGIVIAAKKVPVKILKDYNNPLLDITEEDNILGYKHVFQTRLTKDTVHERIRAPFNMWDMAHTYIDNDVQKVLDLLDQYYQ